MSDLEQLMHSVKKFCDDRDWDQYHGPKDLAIGLATEASELLQIFRFLQQEQERDIFADPQQLEGIKDELADVLFFLLRFAQRNDIDLEMALAKKLRQNAKKYPIDKARGSNKKYTQL